MMTFRSWRTSGLSFRGSVPFCCPLFGFTVLQVMGFPQGLINYTGALYLMNLASFKVDGDYKPFFTIFSGVLQGCPVSRSLFAFALAFGCEDFDPRTRYLLGLRRRHWGSIPATTFGVRY